MFVYVLSLDNDRILQYGICFMGKSTDQPGHLLSLSGVSAFNINILKSIEHTMKTYSR